MSRNEPMRPDKQDEQCVVEISAEEVQRKSRKESSSQVTKI